MPDHAPRIRLQYRRENIPPFEKTGNLSRMTDFRARNQGAKIGEFESVPTARSAGTRAATIRMMAMQTAARPTSVMGAPQYVANAPARTLPRRIYRPIHQINAHDATAQLIWNDRLQERRGRREICLTASAHNHD